MTVAAHVPKNRSIRDASEAPSGDEAADDSERQNEPSWEQHPRCVCRSHFGHLPHSSAGTNGWELVPSP